MPVCCANSSDMTPALEKLIAHFASLPSIGRKSAVRLAYHVLDMSDDEVASFADALLDVKRSIGLCTVCQCYSETEVCRFCEDGTRERNVIMCVEDNRALEAIESLHEYRGKYHVLHGVISPIDGVGPDKLKIKELLARLDSEVEEVVAFVKQCGQPEYNQEIIDHMERSVQAAEEGGSGGGGGDSSTTTPSGPVWTVSPGATVSDVDGTVYSGGSVVSSGKLATGMVVKSGSNEYPISVKGDPSGDGKISVTDVVKLQSHLLNKSNLSGAYLEAADFNADGKVTITDLVKAACVVAGKEKIG